MSARRLAPTEVQPTEFSFTVENLAWAKGRIAKYPEGRQASAVIPLLWRAQEQAGGWLPPMAVRHVAALPGLGGLRLLEGATFSPMFHPPPGGEFHAPPLR